MNAVDFFYSHFIHNKALLIGLLCCLAWPANAEQQAVDTPEQEVPLVLTLSNKWLESNTNTQTRFQKFRHTRNSQLLEASKPKPADIGCSMDVNPVQTLDNSLANRFIGECNFNYQY